MDRIERILIPPEMPVRQTLKAMDDAGEKILFVVDTEQVIQGVVTDGNIRRWILKGANLDEPVRSIMTPDPIVINEGFTIDDARDVMLTNIIECVPVVNAKRQVVSAVWWRDLFARRSRRSDLAGVPVVIMAGGEGTRLAPYTKVIPKPLMPIGDKPIIEMIIDRFADCGSDEFYVSVHYKSNIIKAYFSDFEHPYTIQYLQEETPLGTAGSLHLLNGKLNKTFCVSNCDILIDADLGDIMSFHRQGGNKITIVGSMKQYTIPYGVCEVCEGGKLVALREKPHYDFLVNTGMYVLEPDVIGLIPRDRMYHITELIEELMKNGGKVGVYPVSEQSWLDIGQLEELKSVLNKLQTAK